MGTVVLTREQAHTLAALLLDPVTLDDLRIVAEYAELAEASYSDERAPADPDVAAAAARILAWAGEPPKP